MGGRRVAFDAARARDGYENGRDPLEVLAETLGISRSTLIARAKESGWKRKHASMPRPRRGREEMQAVRLEAAKCVLHKNIIGRLYLAIERKLEEIERRMKQHAESEAPQSAADMEREARSFSLYMQAYGKVVELDEAARKASKGSQAAATMRSEDAEAIRRELALRIERLGSAGEA